MVTHPYLFYTHVWPTILTPDLAPLWGRGNSWAALDSCDVRYLRGDVCCHGNLPDSPCKRAVAPQCSQKVSMETTSLEKSVMFGF